MKVKLIREKVGDFEFNKVWVTEGKVYEVVRKHIIWDDAYYIRDNDGEALLFWEHELEFVED